MAFECQESIEIGLSKNSAESLDNSFKEEVVLTQFDYSSHQETRKSGLKTDINKSCKPKSTPKFFAERGIVSSGGENSLSKNESFSKNCLSITDLPSALTYEILNYLDPKELGIVSCVSTSLYRLASEHHVWKEFYCERWGHPLSPASLGSGYLDEKSWKELFVQREFQSKTFMGRHSVDALYGHSEAVRTVFLLSSKKLIFTSGYDSIVRMWDMEEGLLIAPSWHLGCTIRAVAADTRLLVAGGTDGFIHGWRAVEGHPHLFDIKGPPNQNTEFRLWEHGGPITCLALDSTRIYSGSWDMTLRLWDRTSLKCLHVLAHSDWVWSLVPHDTTVASSSGSDVYVWDIYSGIQIDLIENAHVGNTYALARSHTGKLLFTGGEDGAIHMFDLTSRARGNSHRIATWMPHTGPVYSLAFEFPWLVSASSDGRLSLIDVRKLLKKCRHSFKGNSSRVNSMVQKDVEPPQRMLHGFGYNLFSVDIGCDRIICGGEEGVVRIWNFSQALEIERRARALRGIRLDNRMRRHKMNGKGGQADQCSVAAKKDQISGDRNGWYNKSEVSGKLKA